MEILRPDKTLVELFNKLKFAELNPIFDQAPILEQEEKKFEKNLAHEILLNFCSNKFSTEEQNEIMDYQIEDANRWYHDTAYMVPRTKQAAYKKKLEDTFDKKITERVQVEEATPTLPPAEPQKPDPNLPAGTVINIKRDEENKDKWQVKEEINKDTYKVIARGISDEMIAKRIASEKRGRVTKDDQDKDQKKFMVVTQESVDIRKNMMKEQTPYKPAEEKTCPKCGFAGELNIIDGKGQCPQCRFNFTESLSVRRVCRMCKKDLPKDSPVGFCPECLPKFEADKKGWADKEARAFGHKPESTMDGVPNSPKLSEREWKVGDEVIVGGDYKVGMQDWGGKIVSIDKEKKYAVVKDDKGEEEEVMINNLWGVDEHCGKKHMKEATNPANYTLFRVKFNDGRISYHWMSKRDTGNQGNVESKEDMKNLFGSDFEKHLIDKTEEEMKDVYSAGSSLTYRHDDYADNFESKVNECPTSKAIGDQEGVPEKEVEKYMANTGIDFSKFNLQELLKGIKVEKEHAASVGGGLEVLLKIAVDHLKELPDYYTRLDKMEKEAGKKETTGVDPETANLHDGDPSDTSMGSPADSPHDATHDSAAIPKEVPNV